ncbi:MAG: DUF4388 domain-containing protein [Deltaproteobacteria bacterium]|nr:DUF4388 domain-containing protein [Deltaproteobacteria bacterium]
MLAHEPDLGVELVKRLDLSLVVVNTPAENTVAFVNETNRRFLSQVEDLKMTYDCLVESRSWPEIEHGDRTYFFERNATPARIRSVLDMASFAEGLVGSVLRIDLVDFLQLVMMKNETRAVVVRSPEGSGRILVKNGEIVDASCGSLRGTEALYKILAAEHGQFTEVAIPSDIERTITEKSTGLLLNAMRLRDERGRAAGDAKQAEPATAEAAPAAGDGVDPFAGGLDLGGEDKQ